MAVVLSEDGGKILILRREIFILWDLPGGKIEKGETPEEAAVRECREESGYEIEIERETGQYRHQSVYGPGDQLTRVFLAHIKGGSPKRFGFEMTGLRWCSPSCFPRGFQPLHRQIVQDALDDSGILFERRLEFPRWKLYPARAAFILMGLIDNTLRFLRYGPVKGKPRSTGKG